MADLFSCCLLEDLIWTAPGRVRCVWSIVCSGGAIYKQIRKSERKPHCIFGLSFRFRPLVKVFFDE